MLKLVQSPTLGTSSHAALAAHMRHAAVLWIAYEAEYIAEGYRFRQIAGAENFDRAARILDDLLEQGMTAEQARAELDGEA